MRLRKREGLRKIGIRKFKQTLIKQKSCLRSVQTTLLGVYNPLRRGSLKQLLEFSYNLCLIGQLDRKYD